MTLPPEHRPVDLVHVVDVHVAGVGIGRLTQARRECSLEREPHRDYGI